MTAGDSKPTPQNHTARTYFDHSSAQRVNTDAVLVDSLRSEYPSLHLTIIPRSSCNLITFAQAGNGGLASIDQEKDRLRWSQFVPPPTRLHGAEGGLAESIKFGKFLLDWEGKEYVVFVAEGRDGGSAYPAVTNQYVLSASVDATDRLLLAAGKWTNELHGEVWVFDGGYWEKSAELWDSVAKASWDDVILDKSMKDAIRNDVDHFFDSRETYENLKIPWKRGIIYYGPPGNGKTISIKATMHALYEREAPIPTLYVRSLSSFGGPEYSINQIFSLARRTAPCYLVFEDLDSIVTDSVRSYFLNEVDGIKRNDGILMLGSTNHLDRLDPGISKRPSRFDRKYLFPNPNKTQREAYAHYWQKKLESNKDIGFPDALCKAIAGITDGFSFAYIQEAMVASLLTIAASGKQDGKCLTWDEIMEQRAATGAPARKFHCPFIGFDNCHDLAGSNLIDHSIQHLLPAERCLYHRSAFVNHDNLKREIMRVYGNDFVGDKVVAGIDHYLTFVADEYTRASQIFMLDDRKGLDKLVLWREFQRQVKILRDEMGDEDDQAGGQVMGKQIVTAQPAFQHPMESMQARHRGLVERSRFPIHDRGDYM